MPLGVEGLGDHNFLGGRHLRVANTPLGGLVYLLFFLFGPLSVNRSLPTGTILLYSIILRERFKNQCDKEVTIIVACARIG